MEAPTDNDDGNPNLQATPSVLPPPSVQAAASLHVISDDNSAPVPLAQIDAANAEMELEYEARYGPTKNMKGRPELIQDKEAPMPSQAQIVAAQEAMDSEAKASGTKTSTGMSEIFQDEEAPMRMFSQRQVSEDYDDEGKVKANSIGKPGEGNSTDLNTPAASTMQTESLEVEHTAEQLSSVQPASTESLIYSTALRGSRQNHTRRNQRQSMASAATRLFRGSTPSPQTDENTDAVSSPPLLEATLVEDQPEIPIYDAVPIDSNDTPLPLPWWKRYRGFMVGGFGLLVGMSIALGVSLNSNRSSGNDRDVSSVSTVPPTSSPSFNDSVTSKPTRTPTQAPSTSSQPSSALSTSLLPTVHLQPSSVPSSPPSTSPPSVSPTPQPTAWPTLPPSLTPTTTHVPSSIPSSVPTYYPTVSHQPTRLPTASPTPQPTVSPVLDPTGSPSTNVTTFIKRQCNQMLQVEELKEFNDVEMGIYRLIMESYTSEFGYMVGPPQIKTTGEVTDQTTAGGRRLQGDNAQNLLVIDFTMQYESRYGYDIDDYPRKFSAYVNANLEKVTADMQGRFLPVVEAQDVIVYNTAQPTLSPSNGGDPLPTINPTPPPIAADPTGFPTASPITRIPTAEPTASPVVATLSPTASPDDPDQTSFVVGLVAGLGGAFIVVLLLLWHMRRKSQQKEQERRASRERARANQDNPPRPEEGLEVATAVDAAEAAIPSSAHGSSQHNQYDNYPPQDNGASQSPPGGIGTKGDSIFSNPSMVSGGGSFSSNPDDHQEGVSLEILQDEFDVYKNQDLEYMRSGVEDAVYGTEGMMSLAMTRALMEDEDVDINPTWGGAEDPESIEANGLCETNDWLRRNKHSTLEERNLFFQEILNRMVTTVRRGMISPTDGTRAIHCCAAMLGLQLEKDLPNNVLLVHGMRKTQNPSLGRSYLVDAFTPFGAIEGASIAPSNRGFGFVRFVSPKSVQRALERFRISEIEVQDVSVMIKPLKADPLL